MKHFLRFCVVGAIGFVIDGGILALLTQGLGLGPILARVFSFSVAVFGTWLLNRSWAFRDRPQTGIVREFIEYVTAQGLGLIINFGGYAALVLYAPYPFNYPLLALCIATGVSLVFNFIALNRFVFADQRSGTADKTGGYTGTDNLEIMAEATNYNAFLLSLVLQQARVGMHILDYGAGIGTFATACREHGLVVQCIEPDAAQAEIIRQAGIPVSTDLAEIGDGSLDLIYSFNVLEHIEDDRAVLRQLHQKLKPRGRLLMYVPAFQVLYSSMDRKVGHLRRYMRGELSGKVRQAGFMVQSNRYVDSLGFPVALLYKAIGSDSGTIDRRSLILYDRLVFPVSLVLDYLFGYVLGKNVYLIAEKPE